jgi:replicative DNA helicase
LDGATLICLSDGRRVPISEAIGRDVSVVSIGPDLRFGPPTRGSVQRSDPLSSVEVKLASGRAIRAASGTGLLSAAGWTAAVELRPGSRVAISRFVPEPDAPIEWPAAQLALLGQLIGDGSYLRNAPLRYTTGSEQNSALVASAAHDEFGATVRRYSGQSTWHQLLISGNGDRWHPAGVNRWLRDLGIFGQRSHEKRVPSTAFQLSTPSVQVLLRHLWATDGCIWLDERRNASRIHYSTNSPGLAGDVAALLLRLGIVARISHAKKGGYRPGLYVDVSGSAAQLRFLDTVSAFGPKRLPAKRLRRHLTRVRPNTNVDTLPVDIFKDIRARMRQTRITTREMARRRGTAYGGNAHFGFAPSRATVLDYAEHLDDAYLFGQATSDLFWDTVTHVTAGPHASVYGLTIAGQSSWLADGVLVRSRAETGAY